MVLSYLVCLLHISIGSPYLDEEQATVLMVAYSLVQPSMYDELVFGIYDSHHILTSSFLIHIKIRPLPQISPDELSSY
jgi:hypothetical protein